MASHLEPVCRQHPDRDSMEQGLKVEGSWAPSRDYPTPWQARFYDWSVKVNWNVPLLLLSLGLSVGGDRGGCGQRTPTSRRLQGPQKSSFLLPLMPGTPPCGHLGELLPEPIILVFYGRLYYSACLIKSSTVGD